MIKTEFLSPYHYNSGSRSWKPVLLEINSTQLNIYELKVEKKVQGLIIALYNDANQLNDIVENLQNEKPHHETDSEEDCLGDDAYGGSVDNMKQSTSNKWKSHWQKVKYQKALNKDLSQYHGMFKENKMLFEPTESLEEYDSFKTRYQGKCVASYTLNGVNVGEAPSLNHLISSMYKEDKSQINLQNYSTLVKYKNTLRVRIELKQMLFQFWSFYGMLHWYRNLKIGSDLSFPIETRTLTKLKSIPNRRNNQNNSLLAATEAAASFGRGTDNSYDEFVTCFNDPFSSDPPKQQIHTTCSCNQSISPASICSNQRDSVFSRRRESVASTSTGVSNTSLSCCKYYKTINSFKFVSYDMVYATSAEKQYISNCIPDLNSFDKWDGHQLTLSNYIKYLDNEQMENPINNLLISIPALAGSGLDLKKNKDLRQFSDPPTNSCRNFYIHQSGLVSVVD